MKFNVIIGGRKYFLQGGKIVGQGGQGCVIGPELYTKDPNFVTKIAKYEDATPDFNISKKLFKIDPEERYGVYYRGRKYCNVTKTDLDSEHIVADPDGERCAEIAHRIESETFCAIKMPRFDYDLKSHLPDLDRAGFVAFFKELWACVSFLHHHKYIHGDIKPDNIAFYKGRPVLFDWGWTFHLTSKKIIKEVFDDFSRDAYWAPILQEKPVAHPILALLYFNDIYNMAKAIKKLLSRLQTKFDFDELIRRHNEILINQEYFCEMTVDQVIHHIFK